MRLRTQKSSLLTCGKEMVIRGLKDLDELNRVEQQESELATSLMNDSTFGIVDQSTVGLPLDPGETSSTTGSVPELSLKRSVGVPQAPTYSRSLGILPT